MELNENDMKLIEEILKLEAEIDANSMKIEAENDEIPVLITNQHILNNKNGESADIGNQDHQKSNHSPLYSKRTGATNDENVQNHLSVSSSPINVSENVCSPLTLQDNAINHFITKYYILQGTEQSSDVIIYIMEGKEQIISISDFIKKEILDKTFQTNKEEFGRYQPERELENTVKSQQVIPQLIGYNTLISGQKGINKRKTKQPSNQTKQNNSISNYQIISNIKGNSYVQCHKEDLKVTDNTNVQRINTNTSNPMNENISNQPYNKIKTVLNQINNMPIEETEMELNFANISNKPKPKIMIHAEPIMKSNQFNELSNQIKKHNDTNNQFYKLKTDANNSPINQFYELETNANNQRVMGSKELNELSNQANGIDAINQFYEFETNANNCATNKQYELKISVNNGATNQFYESEISGSDDAFYNQSTTMGSNCTILFEQNKGKTIKASSTGNEQTGINLPGNLKRRWEQMYSKSQSIKKKLRLSENLRLQTEQTANAKITSYEANNFFSKINTTERFQLSCSETDTDYNIGSDYYQTGDDNQEPINQRKNLPYYRKGKQLNDIKKKNRREIDTRTSSLKQNTLFNIQNAIPSTNEPLALITVGCSNTADQQIMFQNNGYLSFQSNRSNAAKHSLHNCLSENKLLNIVPKPLITYKIFKGLKPYSDVISYRIGNTFHYKLVWDFIQKDIENKKKQLQIDNFNSLEK